MTSGSFDIPSDDDIPSTSLPEWNEGDESFALSYLSGDIKDVIRRDPKVDKRSIPTIAFEDEPKKKKTKKTNDDTNEAETTDDGLRERDWEVLEVDETDILGGFLDVLEPSSLMNMATMNVGLKVKLSADEEDVSVVAESAQPVSDIPKESRDSQAQRVKVMAPWYKHPEARTIPEFVFRGLSAMKLNNGPMPIQSAVFTAAISKRQDVIGAAATGSGKTLAFLIPVVTNLYQLHEKRSEPPSGVEALIIAPSREISRQIHSVLESLLAFQSDIKAVMAIGGLSHEKQVRLIDWMKPSIIVGTPGRVLAVHQGVDGDEDRGVARYFKSLDTLKILVLDEGDQMVQGARGDFEQLIRLLHIIRITRRKGLIQRMIFSATLAVPWHLKRQFARKKRDVNHKGKKNKFAEKSQLDILVECVGLRTEPSELFSIDLSDKRSILAEIDARKRHILGEGVKLGESGIDIAAAQDHAGGDLQTSLTNAGVNKADTGLPSGLRVIQELCETDTKRDVSLYRHLVSTLGMNGKAIVFVNAKSSVHRLAGWLRLIFGTSGEDKTHKKLREGLERVVGKAEVVALHSDLKQRHRFARIEEFGKPKTRSILVATDGWARGLDVPNVNLIIHYHAPRNSAIFVHRSGRTARGVYGKGLVLCLPILEDIKLYRAIFAGLQLPPPIEVTWVNTHGGECVTKSVDGVFDPQRYVMNRTQQRMTEDRVSFAKDVYQLAATVRSEKAGKSEMRRMAKCLEESVTESDSEDSDVQDNRLHDLVAMKTDLYSRLATPIFKKENLFLSSKKLNYSLSYK